jgi:hypothetical protein
MVSYTRAVGKGAVALEKFGQYLDTPYLSHTAYQNLFEYHHAASSVIANASMNNAAKEIKKTGHDIGVSIDGTWQRRGHSSHNGVVTAISISTGKWLDFGKWLEVMSNICKSCEIWSKKDKNSLGYQQWEIDHKCCNNHSGSAAAMEPRGAVAIFKCSEATHGLRHTTYLGDGDSASYKKVHDSKPYEDVDVIKVECVGHIQKRLGNRLRKLRTQYRGRKLSDGKPITGAGRLTEQKIDTLQNYYGFAIRQNSDSLVNMQRSVLASLYHVSSTDSNPNHHMCPSDENSWCNYSLDTNGYNHKHGLPEVIVELLEPIYDELSDAQLLSKCLHGKTQNSNEALNKVIWDFWAKEVHVGRRVVEDAVCMAVSHFNDGNTSTICSIFGQLGILHGQISESVSIQRDVQRIGHSKRKSTDRIKKRRKRLRAERKGFSDKTVEEEGNLYEAGAH